MGSKTENPSIPGDKVAVEEEFEAGNGTYINEGIIRSVTTGNVVSNLKTRIIEVNPSKINNKIPHIGDIVVGQVETAQGNNINVRILFLNNIASKSGFIGLISTRKNRGRNAPRGRPQTICKIGDLVKAKVVGNIGMIITLTLDSHEFGVISAICSICGSKLVDVNINLKCVECGNIEHRKLASDYNNLKSLEIKYHSK